MNMEKLRVFSLPNILGDSKLKQAYFCFSLTFTLNIPLIKVRLGSKVRLMKFYGPWGQYCEVQLVKLVHFMKESVYRYFTVTVAGSFQCYPDFHEGCRGSRQQSVQRRPILETQHRTSGYSWRVQNTLYINTGYQICQSLCRPSMIVN